MNNFFSSNEINSKIYLLIEKIMSKRKYNYAKEPFASGSYGSIYIIRDKKLRKNFVSKVSEKSDIEYIELDILSKLNHSCIMNIRDLYIDSKNSYYVMDIADSDLNNFIKNEDISPNDRIRMMYEIISGICFLHKNGIYHNDIKPANILVFNKKCRITDFGLSSYDGGLSSIVLQTAMYRSPELYKMQKDYVEVDRKLIIDPKTGKKKYEIIEDLRHLYKDFFGPEIPLLTVFTRNLISCDMWALGATLYEIINPGTYLFWNQEGDDVEAEIVNNLLEYIEDPRKYLKGAGVPDNMMELFLSLLNPSPNLRPQTGEEVLSKCELFSPFGKPIDGFVRESAKLNVYCDDAFNVDEIVNFTLKKCIDKKIRTIVYFNSVDFYYRLINKVDISPAKLMACALYLYEKIYYFNSFDYEDILDFFELDADDYPQIEFESDIASILQITHGVITNDNLYTYAYSVGALKDSVYVTRNCLDYSQNNFKEIMLGLQMDEPYNLRNRRKDKKYSIMDNSYLGWKDKSLIQNIREYFSKWFR